MPPNVNHITDDCHKPVKRQSEDERKEKKMSYAKLRGRIREVCGSENAFAKELGIDKSTLSSKLNGNTKWNEEEIMKACEILQISIVNVHDYFFKKKVVN